VVVTVVVVDALELVDVDHHRRQRLASDGRSLDDRTGELEEGA